MELIQLLAEIDLFNGLHSEELLAIAAICHQKTFQHHAVIARQGELSDELYIIASGFVEVLLEDMATTTNQPVVHLGSGQIIGEISLLDQGPRSATLKSISDLTIVYMIHRRDFEALCATNEKIGYIVMRNLALDLSFKLRHRNIRDRGRHERL